MADTLALSGQITTQPVSGIVGGDVSVGIPLSQNLTIQDKLTTTYRLSGSGVVTVGFGPLDGANFIFLSVVGGKVRARFTSADGTQQSLPIDGLFVWTCQTVPVTALDLTPELGAEPVVNVFLAQMES